MSERRKKKDDTWTKEELNKALHRNERSSRKERISEDGHRKTEKHRREKSAKENVENSHPDERRERHKREERRESDRNERRSGETREERHKRREERERRKQEPDSHHRRKERREDGSAERTEEHDRRKRRDHEERKEKRERRGDDEKREKKHRQKERVDESERRREHRQDKHGEKKERGHKSERLLDEEEYLQQKENDRHRREKGERKSHRSNNHEERERRSDVEKKEHRQKSRSDKEEKRRHERRNSDDYKERSKKKEEIVEESNYNYDDEEFENYEDDFEDGQSDSNEQTSEMNVLIKAIQEENERVNSARATMSPGSDVKVRSMSPSDSDSNASVSNFMKTNITFGSSGKKSMSRIKQQKILKRRNDLIHLIQLNVTSCEMFELAPVTEYTFYIKNFGGKNSRQVSSQCNEDALDVEVETDQPETVEKWTQHPQEGANACGGPKMEEDTNSALSILSLVSADSQSFSNFLKYASEIVESSFVESTIWRDSKSGNRSVLTFCDSYVKFNTNLAYLQGRKILHTAFGDEIMAVSFGPASHNVNTRIDLKGIITVWKLTNTEHPDKVLVCDALPTACTFPIGNNHVLFVGTDDGSLLVYDLNESSALHQTVEVERNVQTVLRNPTYTTSYFSDAHSSPIVCLNSVGSFANSSQIFSLEEAGKICTWVAVEILSEVDDEKGLAPNGRLKLVKSLIIELNKNGSTTDLGCRATCACCPDLNVFYVGTDLGNVMSLTREKKLKTYSAHNAGCVTSISFNKFNSRLMLVSYETELIALFHIKHVDPVMSWTIDNVKGIQRCDWSNCRASVFFAIDSANRMHVWDIMALDSAPIASDSFKQKIVDFQVNSYSNNPTNLIVSFDSCEFELHRISPHFIDSVADDETSQITKLVEEFC